MEIPGLGVGNRPSLPDTESLLGYSPLHPKRGPRIRVRLYSDSNGTRIVVERDADKKATAIEETSRKRYCF